MCGQCQASRWTFLTAVSLQVPSTSLLTSTQVKYCQSTVLTPDTAEPRPVPQLRSPGDARGAGLHGAWGALDIEG